MPVRPIILRQHAEDARRREHVDEGIARARTRIAIAFRPPPQQIPAPQREYGFRLAWNREHRPVGQTIDRKRMAALVAAIEPLGMKNTIHLSRTRRHRFVPRGSPARRKRERVATAAFEAGPVPGRKRGRFVEKEQLGIAVLPNRAMPSLELGDAADPLAGNPAPRAERAIVAMKPAAAVAHEQPAGGDGDELAGRSDAVLQGHGGLAIVPGRAEGANPESMSTENESSTRRVHGSQVPSLRSGPGRQEFVTLTPSRRRPSRGGGADHARRG